MEYRSAATRPHGTAIGGASTSALRPGGFMSGGEHYLHLEEAAFLADRGNLLLFEDATGRPGSVGKRLLSLEEVLHAMAAFGVPLERYLLYSGLARLGFIVRR
ncbi:hypothetical protein MNEG_13116 [Monoraphidium neglectum]|uniref:tRNA-splicing endonuclease subunit Sen54 N-terminal domain-containing protein n=1 Tax=Monoraphidium neglectum TaxID=145388 RepID=A0A0D2MIL7_9CHLO|nr:hypothetical protein MNEG_13116 [Monoraphidium neglectum]KIY94845.1 hypothetical protein MNEG_13116 [Monoraphidium neglectum]|eukprot:XP_013893865.1 hypothetical protein MNEG_13116 [Monoraphidium neglectum]